MAAGWIRLAALLAIFAASGCQSYLETDQIAQGSMIGMSERKLKACLGAPARRIPVGVEQIWVYPIGTLSADKPALAIGADNNMPLLASTGGCEARFVVDRFGVSQVKYTAAGGGPMPFGQLCVFAAAHCLPE